MVNRLGDLGGYQRLESERENKVYSYLGDPMVELSRETDNLLHKIQFNLTQMKAQKDTYQRDTISRSENQTFSQYQRTQELNRKDISKVKENIKKLQELSENCDKDSEDYKIRSKEATKYLYRLRECLQTHINSENELNRTVELKKQRVQRMVPPGLRLADIEDGQYSAQTKNAASDLLQKLEQLERLARSVNDCVRMMEDIQFLVDLQKKKIDIVGDQLRVANQYLDKADKQLEAKVQQQSSGIKKKCLLILLALVVAGVAGFVLYKTGVI